MVAFNIELSFGLRINDPALGRWFAPDPAEQFHNPYLAMGNNPVIYVDPNGEFIDLAAGILFQGLVGGLSAKESGGNFWKGFGIGAATAGFGAAASSGIRSAFGEIGGSGISSELSYAAANGVVGGISSSIQGGKFSNSFANSALNSYATGDYAKAKANKSFEEDVRGRWIKYTRGNLKNVDSYFGGGYFETGLASGDFIWDKYAPDWSWQTNSVLDEGIWTIGATGTASAGMVGGSFEAGFTLDFNNGFQVGLYGTLEHAVGADLSAGGVVNYHSPVNSSTKLTASDIEGWGESINGGAWVVDGTYGGDSFQSGLNPNNYSRMHPTYETYGAGLSVGSPIGFTLNKGYTWTTPTIGW